MAIDVSDFKGEAPRIAPRLLPNDMAQNSANARLLSGNLEDVGEAALFLSLIAVAVDPTLARLVIADANKLRVIPLSTGSTFTLSGTGNTAMLVDGAPAAATFNSPQGVIVDALGTIYGARGAS